MRLATVLAAAIFVSSVSTSIQAQGRGNGHAKKPATTTTRGKTDVPKPAKNTVKTNHQGAKQTTKAENRAVKADAKVTTKRHPPVLTTTSTSVTPTTPTSTRVKNPKLESRLLAMLPPGATVNDASAGFKNWGQFVAAVHVSNNLGIPFADLKSAMTGIPIGTVPGTTPTVTSSPMSLGQAIQSLKGMSPESGSITPTRVDREVKRAEDSATADLRQSRDRS